MTYLLYILLSLLCYVVGSIPTAFIVVKLFTGKNVMEHGTGNVGTMNTHRTTNSKVLTLLVLLGDLGKGAVAYLLAGLLIPEMDNRTLALVLAGTLSVIGHNYSLFLQFKGGKGLATGAGFLALVHPGIVGVWIGAWIVVMLLTRIMVLGQIIATVVTPLITWLILPEHLPVSFAISLPVFIKHAPRIKNILNGTEPKLYYKVRDTDPSSTDKENKG
ncbi:MAG TPA: glycerol-3-phosphate 1-O-acyltransferase PlsY [bacterium]|nr:glycerol-3-phosphate 1-O-acyltransferase PlsY [bacterium]